MATAPDNASTDNGMFTIGQPSEYIGGHIAIGVVTFIETALPVILYYAWADPRLKTIGVNKWYHYSWKAATYGGFLTFIFPFLGWCLSFMNKNMMSYIYLGVLVLFGGVFGWYISATTIIYQFQAIRVYSNADAIEKSEIWWFFGVYLFTQLLMAFLGKHYLMDSIFYLMAADIKQWCEDHPGVCQDYNVLDMA